MFLRQEQAQPSFAQIENQDNVRLPQMSSAVSEAAASARYLVVVSRRQG